MRWESELTFFVTPKSGPMRPMRTLRELNLAMLDDLTFRDRQRAHWVRVRRLLLVAADTGSAIDVRLVTEALIRAVEAEGWLDRKHHCDDSRK